MTTRGERILEAIEDEVLQRLNPSGDDCWHCGGEGETHDCIDDCCEDAEIGCELCRRPCIECKIFERNRLKAVREEVIKSGDIEVATAWLKDIGRWRDGITEDQIKSELAAATAKLTEPASAGENITSTTGREP
jgi:hypothetical protein